jgi:hypothetical protein
MTRKSLRPHLNQIRTWVRQGRTDAWIAHQLEVTVQQIGSFKRENDLAPDDEGAPTEEVDLRANDDEAIAAELEAEAARKAEEDAEAARRAEEEAAARAAAGESDDDADADEDDEPAAKKPAAKRRSRRGGRGRRKTQQPFEGTFDHGEEGYGLWLDPDVQDDPVYAEHWAGHRAVEVTIEEDQIVIRRAGGDADDPDDD